jgi:hypothetical protein
VTGVDEAVVGSRSSRLVRTTRGGEMLFKGWLRQRIFDLLCEFDK